MLSSAERALSYTNGFALAEFMADLKTQDAVLWRLAVIGEAANNVSAQTRRAIPLEWSDIIGMRHVVVHHYRKLLMPRIWSTVREDLPGLITEIEAYLA